MPNSYIIASGHDNYLRYFKVSANEAINVKSLEAHNAWVRSLTKCNHYLASGSDDSTLKIWKFNKNEELEQIQVVNSSENSKGYFWSLSYLDNGLIAAGRGQNDSFSIRVWDFENMEKSQACYGHRNIVRSLLVIDKTLVSASDDGSLKIWNCENFKLIKTVLAHKKAIICMAFNRKLWILATVGNDCLIKFWCLKGLFRCFNSIQVEEKVLTMANFEKFGLLVSGSENGFLRFWDWIDGSNKVWVSIGMEIHSILCNEEEDLIINSDSSGKITVWKIYKNYHFIL